MTPERLAEIEQCVNENRYSGTPKEYRAYNQLIGHVDAQQKKIEQLQADKAEFDDFVDYIKTYHGKHLWQDYQEWKAK